ncbi:regulatory protein RecX [uncultured Proteiniphilum sp.]|uniref:regulatory protein RecX n=1 Tax=uncultured Proteiniphilum sp. TaxID=497637 RepID=UPI00261B9F00|nr:regulatory protein RecX [uncultured Proteiniphilum sp.]
MDKNGRRITEEKAYAKMARICSQKECAPCDIARKLGRMELPRPVIDKIIDRLKKEKYMDEKRFIRSYIHDKLHFNKWGRRKIILSLKQKQLPQDLIEEVLSEFSGASFGESLQPILEKKWKTVKGKSDYEKRGKLIRYVLSRGFSMDEVMACMKKMRIGEIFDETE